MLLLTHFLGKAQKAVQDDLHVPIDIDLRVPNRFFQDPGFGLFQGRDSGF